MNEKKNKREWIKTAAIVFLTIMLILTFFSNTIMNYSLPEVATQYVQSGSITAKVRGNGVVESGDPYNIMVKETRKVASVAVKVGDKVQQGDILVYLADEESPELEAAKEALEDAKEAYDLELLKAEISAGTIAESQSNTPVAAYRQTITKLQNEVKKAGERVEDLEKKAQQTGGGTAGVAAKLEEEKNKENAEFVLKEIQNRIQLVNSKIEFEEKYTVSGNDASDTLTDLYGQLKELEIKQIDAQAKVDEATLAYQKATAELATNTGDINKDLVNAKTLLEQKEKELNDYVANINAAFHLDALYDQVIKASKEVEKLKEKAMGATVAAEISGTVTAMNAQAGKEVSAAEPVAVLQPENQGYTMSFSVTNEQARTLSPGDKAGLINAWYYNDLDVTLKTIKPDKTDPGKKKLLIFDVTGDVTPGQNLSVSVGQKNANYELVVPNSALREDNNGKFILIVESKNTPLGNRYIATRVDVQVVASDDTQSAITGALYGWEFVITTSTKPIEEGKQVRLADQ